MARLEVQVGHPPRLGGREQVRRARVARDEPGVQQRRRQQERDGRGEERRDDGGLPGRDAEPHGGEEGGRGGEDEEEGAQEGLPVGAWAFRGGFPVKAEEEFRRG